MTQGHVSLHPLRGLDKAPRGSPLPGPGPPSPRHTPLAVCQGPPLPPTAAQGSPFCKDTDSPSVREMGRLPQGLPLHPTHSLTLSGGVLKNVISQRPSRQTAGSRVVISLALAGLASRWHTQHRARKGLRGAREQQADAVRHPTPRESSPPARHPARLSVLRGAPGSSSAEATSPQGGKRL